MTSSTATGEPQQKFDITPLDGGGYSISVFGMPADSNVEKWDISRIGMETYKITSTTMAGPVSLNGWESVKLAPATTWDTVKEEGKCTNVMYAGYTTLDACTEACDSNADC